MAVPSNLTGVIEGVMSRASSMATLAKTCSRLAYPYKNINCIDANQALNTLGKEAGAMMKLVRDSLKPNVTKSVGNETAPAVPSTSSPGFFTAAVNGWVVAVILVVLAVIMAIIGVCWCVRRCRGQALGGNAEQGVSRDSRLVYLIRDRVGIAETQPAVAPGVESVAILDVSDQQAIALPPAPPARSFKPLRDTE